MAYATQPPVAHEKTLYASVPLNISQYYMESVSCQCCFNQNDETFAYAKYRLTILRQDSAILPDRFYEKPLRNLLFFRDFVGDVRIVATVRSINLWINHSSL